MTQFLAACVQLNSGPVMADNLETAAHFIVDAAKAGATFVALPENTGFIVATAAERQEKACADDELPALPLFTTLARDHSVWLMSGSFCVRLPSGKLVNRCYMISPRGEIVARYDKIHLFDVDLPNGEVYRESDTYSHGRNAVVVHTDVADFGMTICYDLRFPHLYRQLAQHGAHVLLIPAAFTVPTGKAHWHVLQRARAIETGCYVLAPAQTGTMRAGDKPLATA